MPINRRTFCQRSGTAALAALAVSSQRLPAQSQPADLLADLRPLPGRVEPIIRTDFENRHEKARGLMRRQGIDALFLSGSNSLYYFSGINMGASDRLFALILPQTGAPAAVCPAFELERVKERMLYGREDIRIWQEDEDPFALSAAIFKERGIGRGVIGIDGNMPFWYYRRLADALPEAHFGNADAVALELRLIKEPKEIALTRRAVEITELAYAAAFRTLRAGMSEGDLGQTIARACAKLGAGGGAGVSFGQSSGQPHGSVAQRNLEEGTVVLVDGGCRVENYPSDITRTIVFGKPGDEVRRVWETVRRAQLAAIRAIRPGLACQEVDRAARQVIEEAGFGPGYRYFAHRLGHGLGLDGHDGSCHLVRGNTRPMQPGMLFTVEPGIYIPDKFGVRLEDNVLVTAEGCEVLGNRLAKTIDQPFG